MDAQKEVSGVISAIRQVPYGESVKLNIMRESKPIDVMVQPKRTTNDGPATIGILLSPKLLETRMLKSDNLFEAAKMAAKYLGEITSQTANGLLSLLGQMLMGKGSPPGTSVSGPIGLIKTGSEIVSTQDATTVLLFAAAISINLGVVNALPLPALDGGQLAFVIAEALSGRKIDQRLQEGITSVAILFLLLVSVSTAFGDVQSLFIR
jgi:RIP metalloprotease RseP